MKHHIAALSLLALTAPGIAQTQTPQTQAVPPTPSHPLVRQMNDAFAGVYEKVAPAVVIIEVKANADQAIQGLPEGMEFYLRGPNGLPLPAVPAEGSGFLISSDGTILTNYHVVASGVTGEIQVSLKDGRSFPAVVVGADKKSDIAVLKIEAQDLPFVELGDSDEAKVGQFAFAIGAPFDLPYTFTVGVISAKGRDDLKISPDYQEYIQTDASINPGNSGGPLCDLDGRVIGVNTVIHGLNRGLGFAVPSNVARNVAEQLLLKGRVSRPWLGIGIMGLEESEKLRRMFPKDLAGVVVSNIQPDTPAFNSRLQVGDVIMKVDGETVRRSRDLQREILKKVIGEPVELELWREGQLARLSVRTGEVPEKFVRTAGAPPPPQLRARGVTPGGSAGADGLYGLKLAEGSPFAEGVPVQEVTAGSAAAASGLRVGDVILEAAGRPVSSAQELEQILKETDSSRGVLLLLERDGQKTIAIMKD